MKASFFKRLGAYLLDAIFLTIIVTITTTGMTSKEYDDAYNKYLELNEKYIIYTKNEHDRGGNTIIYSGKIINKENNQYIENITEGTEWEKLKNIMKMMSRYSLESEKNV